jgi:SAM-dependent methyltransferase
VTVIHSDIKDQPGVDLVCDILMAEGRAAVGRVEPKAIICSNLLEHVEDPQAMLDACLEVLGPGGLLIVTVPRSYPYHRDPIDTLWRPGPEEIAKMIAGRADVVDSAVLNTGSYRDQVRERPLILFRPVFRFFIPFLGIDRWKRSLGKLYWLVAPYRATCLIARKNASRKA